MMIRFTLVSCVIQLSLLSAPATGGNQIHQDTPFRQERATLFRNEIDLAAHELRTVRADRDGRILINTNHGLIEGCDGRLVRHRGLAGIAELDHFDLDLIGSQFAFLTDRMFLPLHGAGTDYRDNRKAADVRVAAVGPGHYLFLSQKTLTEKSTEGERRQENPGFREIVVNPHDGSFILHSADRLASWRNGGATGATPWPTPKVQITGVAAVSADELKVATREGLFSITREAAIPDPRPLPWTELTCITRDGDGRLWMGSSRGAFSIDQHGHVDYYAGRRWLHADRVIDIHADPRGDVYILTTGGLTHLDFELMTLADKAALYQRHLRRHHIRFGLVSDLSLVNGDYAQARLQDTDNDGLWSSIYLAAESFRYIVTHEQDALANAMDGLDSMTRLVTISGIPGFQARSFELEGFKVSDPERWRTRSQHDFEWKGHTSSDEIVGTFFFFSVFHETVAKDDPSLRRRVADLVAAVMDHILDHNLYLVEVDGRPTLWGRWNPEYVNTDQVGGDRRLNSVEILSFLQLAFHMTGKTRYRDEFYRLVREHGYAENTIRYLPDPMGEWNHSDDELYWLSYYNLLKCCFDEDLRKTFLQSAREHVQATMRKQNPLWNFIFGATTAETFDLKGAVWVLREYPLDLRDWRMENSHRKDVKVVHRPGTEPETTEPLPPDERRVHKFNGNEMSPDGGGTGNDPVSGAEYLLPYWMGRYYGFISAPQAPARN